jgi:nitrite reductase/ring-hydroxylating ferredoxin subunit
MAQSGVQKRRIKIENPGELAEGHGREIIVEGRRLALFRIKGAHYAISNLCLHRGGPLSEGELDDYKVTCPWHGWKYDVRTGAFDIIPTLRVNAYPVEEKNGELFVEIE